jgi:hypothetical protein
VVDPVRRVGQALDAVEAGHIVAVRLAHSGAEVAIALAPDEQSAAAIRPISGAHTGF